MENKTPQLLNSQFKVASYNGDDGKERYAIENIFVIAARPVHCSKEGENFDVVLECTNEKGFTLTHFAIKGGEQCTAPLKDGLLWVSDTEPKLADYAASYNDFTQEKFEKMQRKGTPNEPILFFSTDPQKLEYGHEFKDKFPSGKFIHIKFISRHDYGGSNIDVSYVGLVGFEGKEHPYFPVGPIPEELHLVAPPLKAFNVLQRFFLEDMKKVDLNIFLFSSNAEDKAVVKEIAESGKYKDKLLFFHCGAPEELQDQDGLATRLASLIGITSPGIAAFLFSSNTKWSVSGKPLTKEDVTLFCDGVLNGTLAAVIKSAPRPENDGDPHHPGLKIVVANSFKEIVLDESKDVLLDVYADWCGPCMALAPTYYRLAEMMKDVPNLVIAKLDCDVNDTDSKYLPETSIPNIKLFPKGNKEKWVKFKGDRNLLGFLTFLHDNVSEKFDLASFMKHPAIAAEVKEKVVSQCTELVETAATLLSEYGTKLSEAIQSKISLSLTALQEAISKEEVTAEALEVLEKQLEESMKELIKIAEDDKEEKEKAALKNVKKVHSDEEYNKILQDNKDKLVVVDFFATWCGPCVFIAPLLADLSEQHPNVVFVKVDVDMLKETSKNAGIRAMPTFKFFKNGSLVETFEGADPKKLTATVTKHL